MFRVLSGLILFLSIHQLYCSNDTIVTINSSTPSPIPFLNVHINTTSRGTFRLVYPGAAGEENKDKVVSFPAAWMQDDGNSRLYISNGNASQGICMTEYWFFKGKHYIKDYPTFNCSEPKYECVTGYGYDEEVGRYNSTYLGYMGRAYEYRFQREVDIFAGRALDGVGPLTCQIYVGTNDSSYVAMSTYNDKQVTGNSSVLYYNEYFYDDIQMGVIPNSSYFVVPQPLLDYESQHNCSSYPYDQKSGAKIESTTNNTNLTNSSSSNRRVMVGIHGLNLLRN